MTEFKLPELGENIEQGDLVRLMIAPGASVSEGQPVMELETDKAIVEVPSSLSGTVQEIRVKEGQKVKVGQVIFTVENGAGAKQRSAPKPTPPKAEAAALRRSRLAREGREARPGAVRRKRRITGRRPLMEPARAVEFKLPELGENIHQGDLVRLMISPGAKVSEGQPVMELETDKAVVEVPSSVTGVVKEVLVKEGEKIKVGQVIFTLEGGAPVQRQRSEPRAGGTCLRPAGGTAGISGRDPRRGQDRRASPAARPTAAQPPTSACRAIEQGCGDGVTDEPVPAAPHVRRLARELGVDIQR